MSDERNLPVIGKWEMSLRQDNCKPPAQLMVVNFGKRFNKKINERKVTWHFDDLMPSLSKVKCEKIYIKIYIYTKTDVWKKKYIMSVLKHEYKWIYICMNMNLWI